MEMTATTGAGSTLTLDGILQSIREAEEMLRRNEFQCRLGGDLLRGSVKVVESQYAVRKVPVRQHKKRRNQSATYHARIQKKWVKRFGMKEEPCAYVIDNRFLGGFGSILVMQPYHAAMLRGMP